MLAPSMLADGEAGLDPAICAEHADSLSLALLVLLEQLTPAERAAFPNGMSFQRYRFSPQLSTTVRRIESIGAADGVA